MLTKIQPFKVLSKVVKSSMLIKQSNAVKEIEKIVYSSRTFIPKLKTSAPKRDETIASLFVDQSVFCQSYILDGSLHLKIVLLKYNILLPNIIFIEMRNFFIIKYTEHTI